MNTAVQLRQSVSDAIHGELVYGKPRALVSGKLGAVALFSSGELVAYRIRHRHQTRLFVFRTLEVDDRLAARIPGVRPHVRLLFDVHSMGRARLVRGLFAHLRRVHEPADLPDSFFVRIGVVLGGRLPAHKILPTLLRRAITMVAMGGRTIAVAAHVSAKVPP